MGRKKTMESKTTLSLHPSVKQAIDDIASRENLLTAALLRKLVITGLKTEYNIEVRANQVVTN